MIEDGSYSRQVTDRLVEIANGHSWELAGYSDSKGELIDFAATGEYIHNGPECVVCGFSFCYHCDPNGERVPPCPGGRPVRGHLDP